MTVWNTIDDTYSVVPLYRSEATFFDFAPFESISALQCGIVLMIYNPILHSTKKQSHISSFLSLESIFCMTTMHNLLIFARFQSIFSMTVWNTIDDKYSIFPLYRNEATFLAFAPFSEHFQYDSVEYYQ